jgi:POT family proton-dependent oligopeptide transporter
MAEPTSRERFPPSIKYLAWNEAAERYSYYGMASILALYMRDHLHLPEHLATSGYQAFVAAVYLTPIAGALLADWAWGRYRTILWLSFGYVAGHLTLAVWETGWGLAAGLALIAIGAGGIKPCASAFGGDQIPPGNETLLSRLYNLWYWMINLGSTVGTLTIPLLYDHVSPSVAFGVPAIAMAIALVVFWAGRATYVKVPPNLSREAREAPPAADEPPARGALLRIVAVFLPVSVFWALFFQYGSTWTFQAEAMRRDVLGLELSAPQVTTLNAVFILTLIPVFSLWIYPSIERAGLRLTALRKMSAGMFFAVLSFAAAALVERALLASQAGAAGATAEAVRAAAPHVGWQVPQYLLMGVAEVLVSVTALEFAFSQAPRRMKSVVMGLWYVTIASGSILTAVVSAVNRYQGVAYYVFFAALMLAAAVAFALVARWYPERHAGAAAPPARAA